jgi:hypothetical protein
MFFTPKWKKDTDALIKGAQKFLHYKRDLLKPDRIDEIQSRISDLKAALKSSKRDRVDECSKHLRATCENALPRQAQQSWFEENVEVIFVALVVALGIRSYIIQPFRIPTNSMYPSLNGVVTSNLTEAEFQKEKPWLGGQIYDWASKARRWHRIEAPTSGSAISFVNVPLSVASPSTAAWRSAIFGDHDLQVGMVNAPLSAVTLATSGTIRQPNPGDPARAGALRLFALNGIYGGSADADGAGMPFSAVTDQVSAYNLRADGARAALYFAVFLSSAIRAFAIAWISLTSTSQSLGSATVCFSTRCSRSFGRNSSTTLLLNGLIMM